MVLAPGATAVFMSLLGVAPSYLLAIPLLVMAGLSHAAYHAPAPAMVAQVSGGRVGTGMSGVAASLFGAAADALGLQRAFGLLAFTPLLALPFIPLLPGRPHAPTR